MSKEIEIDDLGIEQSAGYKNLIAIKDYARTTRELFRELELKNKNFLNQIQQQKQEIEQLRIQLTELLIKFHTNKKTS